MPLLYRRKSPMFSEKWKEEWITMPNLLSLFRIALIPVYVSVYLHASRNIHYWAAGLILTVSCATDIADGIIARKYDLVTNVGKILDPLADKLTQLSLILSLSFQYTALYPILAIFLLKELFQCGALLFFMQRGKVLTGALWAGKICTTVLFISFIFLVLFPQLSPRAVLFLTAVDTVFLLYSFFSYLCAYLGKGNCLSDWTQNP